LRSLVLDPRALSGVRVAVVRGEAEEPEGDKPDQHREAVHEAALAALRAAGARTVDVELPKVGYEDELAVLHYEVAPGMARYLAALGADSPPRSLADIQAWNREHADAALKFGQVHVDTAVAIDHEAERDAYRQARARDLAVTSEALTAALADDRECLV